MKLINNSTRGYNYEAMFIQDLIKTFGGRAATKNENITQQFDYVLDGQCIDIKWQPNAEKYGTVNFELYEFNTADPSITNQSWYYTGAATMYFWFVGSRVLCINKSEVQPYIDALLNPGKWPSIDMKLKLTRGRISYKNGAPAQAMSRQHGSSRLDNAVTALMPISILESLPSTAIMYTTDHGRML